MPAALPPRRPAGAGVRAGASRRAPPAWGPRVLVLAALLILLLAPRAAATTVIEVRGHPGVMAFPNYAAGLVHGQPCCVVASVPADQVAAWAARVPHLVVFSPAPGLSPFWVTGLGSGLVFSPSTRTVGVVTAADLDGTALGRPLRVVAAPRADLQRLYAATLAERRRRDPLVAAGCLIILAAVALRRRALLMAALSVPLAYLALAAGPLMAPVPALLLFGGAVALCVAVAVRYGYGTIVMATAIAVATDLVRGGPWMMATPIGFSYLEGARYYGLGNEYAGILLGSSLVAAGALARGRAFIFAAAGLAVVALTGSPALGANYGCMLGALAGWGAAWLRLRDGIRWRQVLGLVAAGGLAVGIALSLDRGPLASHLGLEAAHLSWVGLQGLVARKLALNFGFLRTRAYAWLPVLALAAYWLGLPRGRDGFAAAAWGCALGATVNLLLNDSGVVAAGTTVLYGGCALLLRKDLLGAGSNAGGRQTLAGKEEQRGGNRAYPGPGQA